LALKVVMPFATTGMIVPPAAWEGSLAAREAAGTARNSSGEPQRAQQAAPLARKMQSPTASRN
jgi:hypothetical protein